jgi:transcriptional regulator with XRE-family HTH domain
MVWQGCGMTEELLSPSTFLLGELRRARSAAGLSQEDLGRTINYSGSLVSAVENGQRPPTRDYLVAVDGALHTNGLFERLQSKLAGLDQAPVWFRDWLIIEREATLIRWFEPLVVPGILQTPGYAHSIIADSGMVDFDEVEERVAARIERRSLLERPKPPTLITIIDEGVLRRRVGSSAVMAQQCGLLRELAVRPHIQIHVVPFSAGAHAGLGGAFTLARGAEQETAHIDGPLQAQITDRGGNLDRLTRRWEAIRGEALPRSLSLELIKEVAESWQT